MSVETPPTGVIHDLGYRRYEGPRLGRWHIVAALTWHSSRSAFGFGRGAKAKIVPVLALAALCLPAVVNAYVMSQGHSRLVDYDTYIPVLPLYFSRPIKSIDYPLAKFLGFTAACLVMMEVPLLILYAGSVANVHGGTQVWAQTRALIPGLLVGLMWAVVLAAVSLFLASLTGRRGFATGAVAIFFLLTYTLAQVLLQVESAAVRLRGPA